MSSHPVVSPDLEVRATQGAGGVTVLWRCSRNDGYGTPCSGLADKVWIGHRMGSMILEVFSSFSVSVTVTV